MIKWYIIWQLVSMNCMQARYQRALCALTQHTTQHTTRNTQHTTHNTPTHHHLLQGLCTLFNPSIPLHSSRCCPVVLPDAPPPQADAAGRHLYRTALYVHVPERPSSGGKEQKGSDKARAATATATAAVAAAGRFHMCSTWTLFFFFSTSMKLKTDTDSMVAPHTQTVTPPRRSRHRRHRAR